MNNGDGAGLTRFELGMGDHATVMKVASGLGLREDDFLHLLEGNVLASEVYDSSGQLLGWEANVHIEANDTYGHGKTFIPLEDQPDRSAAVEKAAHAAFEMAGVCSHIPRQ